MPLPPRRAATAAAPRPCAPQDEAALAAGVTEVADEPLRAALLALGRTVRAAAGA